MAKGCPVLVSICAWLLTGCAFEFESCGKRVAVGLPKPPTNAVVGISYTKIGIVAEQNPATQTPSLTVGYVRASYYRVPTGTNWSAPLVEAGVTTTQDGLKTTIAEKFQTGK